MNYNFKLSFKIWEVIFQDNDVNKIFNYFLNQILRLFYSTFLIIDQKKGINNRDTSGQDLQSKYYVLKKIIYTTNNTVTKYLND